MSRQSNPTPDTLTKLRGAAESFYFKRGDFVYWPRDGRFRAAWDSIFGSGERPWYGVIMGWRSDLLAYEVGVPHGTWLVTESKLRLLHPALGNEKCQRCYDLFYDPKTLIEEEKSRAAEWEDIANKGNAQISSLLSLIEKQQMAIDVMRGFAKIAADPDFCYCGDTRGRAITAQHRIQAILEGRE